MSSRGLAPPQLTARVGRERPTPKGVQISHTLMSASTSGASLSRSPQQSRLERVLELGESGRKHHEAEHGTSTEKTSSVQPPEGLRTAKNHPQYVNKRFRGN